MGKRVYHARRDLTPERISRRSRSFHRTPLDNLLIELCPDDHIERYHPCETIHGYGNIFDPEDAALAAEHILRHFSFPGVQGAEDRRHRRRVRELMMTLGHTDTYSLLLPNAHYGGEKGHRGEVDVLAIIASSRGLFFHNWEVKSSGDEAGRKHGKRQVRRWMDYMHRIHDVPYAHLDGFIFSPKTYRDELRK